MLKKEELGCLMCTKGDSKAHPVNKWLVLCRVKNCYVGYQHANNANEQTGCTDFEEPKDAS